MMTTMLSENKRQLSASKAERRDRTYRSVHILFAQYDGSSNPFFLIFNGVRAKVGGKERMRIVGA